MARQTATAERKTTQAPPQQAPTGNLPATQQQNGKPPALIVQFRDYVQARMATLEESLPPTIPPKRFVAVLMTALQNKPKLLECTFPSLWNACVRAAQDGLLPDGREGAIAPYGENKEGKRTAEIATWMPMVEGYRKKVFEAGGVKSWRVEVVFENDEFDYDLAEQKIFFHKRKLTDKPHGGVIGAYSIAKLANDEVVLEVMSAFQIKQIADKSKANNGPWKDATFFPEMCKKVVARRHYKQLPHSESMDAMVARDDEAHGLLDRDDTPAIARVERRQLSPRDVMDQYAGAVDGAGQVIDHDPETGEASDQPAGNAQSSDQAETTTTKQVADPAVASGGSTKEGGGRTGASATSSPSAQSSDPGTAKQGETSGTGKEAGAAEGTTGAAPASDNSSNQAEGSAAADSDEMPTDDEQVDGADRPWPPGAVPTDVNEYERYLKTKLAGISKAADVAPWFNSPDEKALRVKCECAARFKELQDLAIARRKELN